MKIDKTVVGCALAVLIAAGYSAHTGRLQSMGHSLMDTTDRAMLYSRCEQKARREGADILVRHLGYTNSLEGKAIVFDKIRVAGKRNNYVAIVPTNPALQGDKIDVLSLPADKMEDYLEASE
ncbi:hypothetical protein KA107_03655 [Candidatus Pacearchaeota archaeon]|nr:hypothetical protein [Candidatus Pacearchaeota archaeon]